MHHLKRRITDAWGWPLQRVVQVTGLSDHSLRAYIRRAELPVFNGAKCVYIDPADLLVVDELDWAQPHPHLEAAVMRSLRGRLVQILAGRDWRQVRPHRLCPARTDTPCNPLQRARRSPRPTCIAPGVQVRVSGPTAAMPQRAGRIGIVERVYWSANSRQDGLANVREMPGASGHRKPARVSGHRRSSDLTSG